MLGGVGGRSREASPYPDFDNAPCQLAPAMSGAGAHPWDGLGQGVAAVYASDGGGTHRSCMDIARGLALSGATVAPTADGLNHGAELMIVVWSA